jgi:hypothetical protein
MDLFDLFDFGKGRSGDQLVFELLDRGGWTFRMGLNASIR